MLLRWVGSSCRGIPFRAVRPQVLTLPLSRSRPEPLDPGTCQLFLFWLPLEVAGRVLKPERCTERQLGCHQVIEVPSRLFYWSKLYRFAEVLRLYSELCPPLQLTRSDYRYEEQKQSA